MTKRIAFAGIGSGVGTTTQVLQMYQFIEYLGSSACILMERGQYENYRKDRKYEKYNIEQSDAQIKPTFDYLLIDYGNAEDPGFKKTEFAGEMAKVIVSMRNAPGTSEIEKRFGDIGDFHQIVTFPRRGSRRGENIYHAKITTDPTVLVEEDLCQDILNDLQETFRQQEKKGILSFFSEKEHRQNTGKKTTAPRAASVQEQKKIFIALTAIFAVSIPVLVFLSFQAAFPGLALKDLLIVIAHFLMFIP